MNISLLKSYLAFTIGVVIHLIIWFIIVNTDSTPWDFTCVETSCWKLFFSELPASLLYTSGTAIDTTIGSAIFGSLWWGILFLFLYKLFIRLLNKSK